MSLTARILFVDDEVNLLKGLDRALRGESREWNLQFESDPAEALERCRRELFSVVVMDMRMPGMNGLECLEQLRAISPHTVRLMLTGNTDADTAVAAVNRGEVFRFLVKPIERDLLVRALRDAVRSYELAATERQLLEQTLFGGVKALLDVLGLVSPLAFGRAQRIAGYVGQMMGTLAPPDAWQINVAGMLSQVGCVTLPEELMAALDAGLPLSADDRNRLRRHPEAARELIVAIPRLQGVADIIGWHLEPQTNQRVYPSGEPDTLALGAQVVRVATEFDRLTHNKATTGDILTQLRQTLWRAAPTVLAAAEHLVPVADTTEGKHAQRLRELRPGVVLAEDLTTNTGLLIVKEGQEVTQLLLRRLHGLLQRGQLSPTTTVEVLLPSDDTRLDDEPVAAATA
jgi:response regulator RpfG family c-di-GMP phosphodiesterase